MSGPGEISYNGHMDTVLAKIDSSGRILIPARFRKELELTPETTIIIAKENGELRMWTRDRAVRRLQELARKYITPGVSVVDELIADRRREAEEEFRD